ncbi:MAG: hypothetical protein D3906_15915 [Candidatus Electrothrix sp. AUS1_2]|nr:hypothetical protein [Candidatus Electrothrix sp. AUS1_2]
MMQTVHRQDFDSPWKKALDAYFPDIHAAVCWITWRIASYRRFNGRFIPASAGNISCAVDF